MKTTYKFILAALAATVTLASCTKDPVPGKSDSDSAVTYRTITVSFDSPTKAKLDGTKPKFQRGDMILLSDGEALDTCKVKVEGGGASIDTKLKAGKSLTAVYPMSAVSCTEPQNITSNLLIPTKQSGKFSDANICVAKSSDGKLTFENAYPILRFYVDSTIAVKSIKIEIDKNSRAYIALDTAKTCDDDDRTIIVDAGEFGTLDKVTGERVCYVAVRNQVPATNLTFTSETETQGTVVRKSPSMYNLYAKVIYNAFIPYSIKVGDQKWGYCNVGAFYPEDKGEYFAWGETKGYKWDAKVWPNGQFRDDRCFDWKNYQYNDGDDTFSAQEYIDFKTKICPEGKLALQCDAANANWGEGWRMPTQVELAELTKVMFKVDTTGGVFDGKLKIPYSGYGSGKILHGGVLGGNQTAIGSIWASTINQFDGKIAPYVFTFSCGYDYHDDLQVVSKPSVGQTSYLYCGHPIRPIYDGTMSGDDAVGLLINSYNDGKTL